MTDWWVLRDGFNGLALKLLQADSHEDVSPNKPAKGAKTPVEDWNSLDELYQEFTAKEVTVAVKPWVDEKNGPWKEFIIKDTDGYHIAFGGTDGH